MNQSEIASKQQPESLKTKMKHERGKANYRRQIRDSYKFYRCAMIQQGLAVMSFNDFVKAVKK